MDARVKIILMIAFVVIAFLADNVPSMLLTCFCTMLFMVLSRVPLKLYFKGLGAIWFLVLLTAVLNCLYIPGKVLFSFWKINITFEGIRQSCFIALRLVNLILISSALTFTTTPTQLTSAIESLLSPLKIFGVKVHDLAMMMTIALRFVPTLLEETEKIMSAQKARGADIGSGGPISRVKAVVPILVPLIVSAFRRAIDLALAMECRCYTDGKGRTKLNPMKLCFRDYAGFLVAASLAAGIIFLRTVPHYSTFCENVIPKIINR